MTRGAALARSGLKAVTSSLHELDINVQFSGAETIDSHQYRHTWVSGKIGLASRSFQSRTYRATLDRISDGSLESFAVYLLMVLGLGIPAWRTAPEPGSRQTAVARDPSHHTRSPAALSMPLSCRCCVRQRRRLSRGLFSVVCPPRWQRRSPRCLQHPSSRVSMTRLVDSCDQLTDPLVW